MLQKILDFFIRLFQRFFSPKERKEPVIIRDPDPEDSKPQDGSDVPIDSTSIEIVTELEEVMVETKPVIATNEPSDPPISPSPPQLQTRYLWCLDNGHGKLTPGKRSPKLKDGSHFFEYEFNRAIVKKIIQELEREGLAFYEVVPEVEVDNFLSGRVLRANNHPSNLPKIFVSVHSNAGPGPKWTSASGIETWFFHGSRTGKRVAAIFQQHLIAQTNWLNRGIKSRATKQFYVLQNTNMPSILTENGFFNNQEQVYELIKDEVRQKIADAHIAAILEIERDGV